MSKKKRFLLVLLLLLIVSYFLGPSPEPPVYTYELGKDFPQEMTQIYHYVQEQNSLHNTKEDNESQIYWANPDSISKTEYSLVYLHGFSASPGEGMPVNTEIAKKYGMNLYVPRLDQHGLKSDEPLLDFSAAGFMNSAYQAIKLGELLGDKVIVMSCSTGSTASIFNLATSDINVHAQIMYAPNIKVADSKAWLLTKPWGLQIARLVKGSNYNIWEVPEGGEQYWYGKYRLESVVELQNMLETSMTKENYSKITVPTFVGYYYEDEENQDHVVSVAAMKDMMEELKVPNEKLVSHAFTEAEAHPIQSQFFSKEVEEVKNQTSLFIENILNIKKPD